MIAEITYYYNIFTGGYSWTDFNKMVDGLLTTFAYTSSETQKQKLPRTSCPGTDLGTITKVEVRCYGYGDGDDKLNIAFNISMSPLYQTIPGISAAWGIYVDVTGDPNINGWTWAKIAAFSSSYVEYRKSQQGNTMYCAKVEIRVTYEEEAPPELETRLLHVRHPALLTVVQKRGEQTIKGYDTLSSLDEEYLTKQVGLDVAKGDIIEVTTLPGISYRYEVKANV